MRCRKGPTCWFRLGYINCAAELAAGDVDVIASNAQAYGLADEEIKDGIRLMATKEGLIAHPVFEGRAIGGLLNWSQEGRFEQDAKVLLMHPGGTPAIHAYAGQFGAVELMPFNA